MQKGMRRIAKVSLANILPYIGKSVHKIRVEQKGHWRNYLVKLANNRMLLFGQQQKCACCGLQGEYFWLEHSGCNSPHLNMYGRNKSGNEIMLTMDHIDPRSNGGKTEQGNLQILCSRCNRIKKHLPLTLEQLRKKAGISRRRKCTPT